jgi:quinone-modifying oxidoreductase subunit QmoC
MAWAVWGMKESLLADPDVWLCYQCGDCSTRCPRGARPGDVLGAIRQQAVVHHAFPRFLARWAGEPWAALLLLAVPAALLALLLYLKEPLAGALGLAPSAGAPIVYSYSHMLPHWLLNGFFGLVLLLVVLLLAAGVARFWAGMRSGAGGAPGPPARGLLASLLAALEGVLTHGRFADCERSRSRYWSHLCVFYGFLALTAVTLWIITSGVNPLLDGPFVYPFGFWSPWKLLANAGGLAVLAGCLLMAWDRLTDADRPGGGGYFDWTLIVTLLAVVITGFIAEALHYVRLEPHRHIAYFTHLLFVLALLLYLPYSKLAHVAYRTAALVFAEHTGREVAAPSAAEAGGEDGETREEEVHAGQAAP